jgi:hypothetical protein
VFALGPIANVKLSREVRPVFPDCCIVCGRPEPGHKALLFAAELRDGHSFLEGSYSLKVPCCAGCAPRLHLRRFLGGHGPLLILAGGLTVMLALGYQKTAGPTLWGRAAVRLFVGGFVLAAIRLVVPPVLGIVPGEDAITFEFRDAGMAEDFRRLNPRAEASGSLTRA